MNRRTFLAMGTAAAAGLAGAQSLAVKKRVAAGAPNPVEGIAPVVDAGPHMGRRREQKA